MRAFAALRNAARMNARNGEPAPSGGGGEAGTARRAALRLLARAPRSENELRRALAGRHGEAEVEAVLYDLRRRGVLDDRTTAREWLAYRSAGRPSGRSRWESDLLRRGFDRELVREVLEDYYREHSEAGDLQRALDRALRGRGAPADAAERRRLAGRLARRGFQAETVWEALHVDAGTGD